MLGNNRNAIKCTHNVLPWSPFPREAVPEYSRNAHEQCCVPALSAQSSPELFLSFKQCRVSALSAQSSPELFLSFKTDEMEGRPLRCVEQPKCSPEQSRKPPEAMEMHVTSAGTQSKNNRNAHRK